VTAVDTKLPSSSGLTAEENQVDWNQNFKYSDFEFAGPRAFPTIYRTQERP